MRLWQGDREKDPDLDVPIGELCDRFLMDGVEDIQLEHPDTSVDTLLRWWLNDQGWIYDDNEYRELYELVLVEGDWG